MLDEDAPVFDFFLAEKLGMTIGELGERMSSEEYINWVAFYEWKNAKAELEAKKK